jgi:hypothetical protein
LGSTRHPRGGELVTTRATRDGGGDSDRDRRGRRAVGLESIAGVLADPDSRGDTRSPWGSTLVNPWVVVCSALSETCAKLCATGIFEGVIGGDPVVIDARENARGSRGSTLVLHWVVTVRAIVEVLDGGALTAVRAGVSGTVVSINAGDNACRPRRGQPVLTRVHGHEVRERSPGLTGDVCDVRRVDGAPSFP